MTNDTKFKTVNQILYDNLEAALLLSLPNYLENACMAMTKFAKYLEDLAAIRKVDFKIINTEVGKIKNQNGNIIPIIGDWCSTYFSCIFGDYVYYFSLNENPFFDDYYTKLPLINGKKYRAGCDVYANVWRVNKNHGFEKGRYQEIYQSMVDKFDYLEVNLISYSENPRYGYVKEQKVYIK